MTPEKTTLRIDWATAKAARFACFNWHYSKKMPVNKLAKLGVWENDKFRGVIIFGLGASAQVHKQFGVEATQCCELVRVALGNHKHTVSRMISIAAKILKKENNGLRVIVSFADPNENHHGGIYQAGNWIYTGMSAMTTEYYFNGDWRHVTDVYKRTSSDNVKKLHSRKKAGKHRYVMPLDASMREQVLPLSKPYPKRSKQAMAGTTGTATG